VNNVATAAKARARGYTPNFTPEHMKDILSKLLHHPPYIKMKDRQSQLVMMDEQWKTIQVKQLFNVKDILVNVFANIDLREPDLVTHKQDIEEEQGPKRVILEVRPLD